MAGQTYFIVVDGFNGTQGDFTLTVTPPVATTTTTSPPSTTTTSTAPPTTTSTSTTTTTTRPPTTTTLPPTTTTTSTTTTTTRPPTTTTLPPTTTTTSTTRPPTTTTTSTSTTSTTTTLPPVTNLTATPASCSEVDLRWTLSTGTASGYNVYRKASADATFTMIQQLGPAPIFPVADTAASASTTYTYGLTAWNSAGTSTMPTVLTNTSSCPVTVDPTLVGFVPGVGTPTDLV